MLAEGISFATPSNVARAIVDELIQYGSVIYPDSGVSFRTITPYISSQLALPLTYGALVAEAAGPAALAGVEGGDIVLSIGGVSIGGETSYLDALFTFVPGDVVDFEIVRDGQNLVIPVELGQIATTG